MGRRRVEDHIFSVAGVTFRKASRYALTGTKAKLRPDYMNVYDTYAVKVYAITHSTRLPKRYRWIGYIPMKQSELIRRLLKKKRIKDCRVVDVTLLEGSDGKLYPRVLLKLEIMVTT